MWSTFIHNKLNIFEVVIKEYFRVEYIGRAEKNLTLKFNVFTANMNLNVVNCWRAFGLLSTIDCWAIIIYLFISFTEICTFTEGGSIRHNEWHIRVFAWNTIQQTYLLIEIMVKNSYYKTHILFHENETISFLEYIKESVFLWVGIN